MNNTAKSLLVGAFKVAIFAGMGAGLMTIFESPAKEHARLPSLSEQDAKKAYQDDVENGAVILGGIELASLLAAAQARKRSGQTGLVI